MNLDSETPMLKLTESRAILRQKYGLTGKHCENYSIRNLKEKPLTLIVTFMSACPAVFVSILNLAGNEAGTCFLAVSPDT